MGKKYHNALNSKAQILTEISVLLVYQKTLLFDIRKGHHTHCTFDMVKNFDAKDKRM